MPLSKPTPSSSSSSSSSSWPPPSHSSSTRLFLGNLHPSVSDYDLVHLLQPFGPLSKLDVVFHRSGPLRGKPKGFAFAEFTKREDALRAKVELDGKQFKGSRALAVNFANQVDEVAGGGAGKPTRRRYGDDDELRPTTLSLVKNARQVKGGPDAKIAAMEAKLQALREKKSGGSAGTGGAASSPSPSQAGSSSLKKAPASAGLPLKPPPSSSSSSSPPR